MQARRLSSSLVVLAILACSGGGDGGTEPPPPPPPPPGGNQQTLGSITPSVTSLSITAGSVSTITVTAHDTNGQVISSTGSPVLTIANTSLAEVITGGQILALASGSTNINISLTHNGVTKTATVPLTVTGALPSDTDVTASSSDYVFSPRVVAVQAGGSVTWNFGSLEHTVNFAPAQGAPASIGSGGYAASITRQFNSAGNFSYQCTIHAGMNGQVFVR